MRHSEKTVERGSRIVACKLLAGLLFLLMTATGAWAQETAQINGTVTDPSGALLPGVEITTTHTERGTVRTAVSNETGSFVLPNLALGTYTLEASLPGFSTFLQTGIVLQVGASPVFTVVLEVGQVTQTIEVQADALLVETRNTGIGQVLDNTRVLELPLNGRQVTELIALSGAAITAPTRGTNRNYPTIAVSVGGGQDNGLSYRMDGGTHNDPFNNLNMPLPFPDALQEFKVETSAIPARNGQHSAGLVSVVTKSGTNEFHGNAFEFVRNEVFNARNTYERERDSLKRNQLGGTFGGPIVRDRLFFFGGYQRTFLRSAPTGDFEFIPTAEALNGDFRRLASAECRSRPVTLRAQRGLSEDDFPFVDNQIDPALLSPVAKNIVAQLPATTDPCGRVNFSKFNAQDEHQLVTRADFQQSDSHAMFVRYSLHRLRTPTDGDNALAINNATWSRQYQSWVIGDTWSISNNVINSFRVTGIRTANTKQLDDFFNAVDVGVTDLYYPEGYPKLMLIDVTGAFTAFQATATPSYTNSTGVEISNDVGWVRGNHQFAFGGSFMRQRMYITSSSRVPGDWRFRGRGTGLPLADFMIGFADRYRQEPMSSWYPQQDFRSLFAQDTWRVNNKLTLNLGVRWEPFTPQVRTDLRHARYQRDWFDQGLRSTVFPNAPKGILFSGGTLPEGVPGDPGMPDTARVSKNQWAHFAPRVGVGWDVGGDGRTSIRAAYGIFYDYPHTYQFNGLRGLAPYFPRITQRNVESALDAPWGGFSGGNPFPFSATQDAEFPVGLRWVTLDEDYKSPYVNQWNLSIQRQIGRDWMATANYMGNSTVHLLNIREANPLIDGVRELEGADPTSLLRDSFINKFDDGGTASYNALWLSLERRTAGMNLRMNYTWAHCIDDGSSFNSTNSGSDHISRRRVNRGNCDLDRRHNFSMSTVYETPEFANPTLRVLAGGWRISGILKVLSGDFFGVNCDCDEARTDEDAQRAQQLTSNVFTSDRHPDQYLNRDAFGEPARGTYGDIGRNSIRGPGIFTLDMGLTRRFAIGENQTLEFRAEAFNLPNHVNLHNPEAGLSDSLFGQITSAGDPRIMQFALKFIF